MKRYGNGKGIGEGTQTVDLTKKRTGDSFIIRAGDLNLIIERLPYSNINEDDIKENIIKYSAFSFEKNKLKDTLHAVVPTENPDIFKGRILKGDIIDMMKNKNIELAKIRSFVEEDAKIRNIFGEDFYQVLWNLPRKYLIALQNFGEGKVSADIKIEEESALKEKIKNWFKDIDDNKELDKTTKNKLKYLIGNSPYIFNQNLIIGSGDYADIKLGFDGISKIQGQICYQEIDDSLEYSNSGKYGDNVIRFIGNYKDSKFIPLESIINENTITDLNDERAQLTYLFLFGDSNLKEYDDFMASSLYLTFLKPNGKVEISDKV